MNYDLIKLVEKQLDSGIGDTGRLNFIFESLKAGKPLYRSDQKYLEIIITRPSKKNKHANPQDSISYPRQARQNMEFLAKSEMVSEPQITTRPEISTKPENMTISEIQQTISELRKDLERVLERLEKLERKLQEKSEFDQKAPEIDQNSLSRKLSDFSETMKLDKTDFEPAEKIKSRPKMDKNTRTVFKILLVITIVTVVSTFAILWSFGTLEGKIVWQDYGITYDDVSTITHWLLFLSVIVLVAWPAFGVATFISNERRKLNH